MTFPANVISLAVSAGSNFLSTMFGGSIAHSTGINLILSNLIATQKRLGTGSQTAPGRGLALIGTGTADGDGNQGSIWDTNARRNLLVNGTGRTKQRATLPITDNSYASDRSRILMENANGFVVTQETTTLPTAPGALYGKRYTVGSGNNGKGGDWMPLLNADMNDLPGGVVSAQCKLYISHTRLANMRVGLMQFTGTADAISGDPVSAWGADGTNPTLAANWAFVNTPASLALAATTWTTVRVDNQTLSSSAKNIALLVWNDARTTTAADFFIVTDIQLERGAVCTDVERIPEALERLLCQDWLLVIGGGDANEALGAGQATSTTISRVDYQFGRSMRTLPAGSVSAAADWSVTAATGALTACSTFTFALNTPRNVSMVATAGSGTPLVAGNASRVIASTTTSARIFLTAEP